MNYRKLIVLAFWATLFITSCKQSQEARKPVSQASGSFMKKSAERNKKLIASEEGRIDSLIKSNPKIKYLASTKGYWYTYITANTIDTLTPKKGDVAFFDYEIKDLQGRIIYSEVELKPQTYAVDKQNIMTGLREGIKIMHKNEKITFLFPSHIAYGYHGDTKKIGTNQPLLCTVTLHNFISEEAFKKEILLRATNAANPTPNQETVIRTKSVNKIKDSLTN
ncbi:MAG TPA: gliding motility-associated peptidyl-prolyl isomerase GldI [Flavobacterium alvei]|nr:gliding motility-associated peptidyl-prolyl isomerase GldI [Flavobacterium alvei]